MSDLLDEEKALNADTSPKSPTPPRGSGANPKLFIVFGVLFAAVLILVAAGIIRYRSNPPVSSSAHDMKKTQEVSASSAIDRINHNTMYGSLNKQIDTNHQQNTQKNSTLPPKMETLHVPAQNLQPSGLLGHNDYEQAVKSPIAVINNFNNANQIQHTTKPVSEKTMTHPSISLPSIPRQNTYAVQNMQKEKAAFLKRSGNTSSNHYINSQLTKPLSPYEAMAGTLISATLMTGINSDLPGEMIATVSRNVYDTVTGNYLLIPQGTKVIGVYDSQMAYGQERVLMAWSRLIFPNGTSFDLQGMPGVDLAGMSGIHDLVNNHYVQIFGSALMFSLFGAAGQLSQPKQASTNTLTNQQIIYGAIGQQMSQTGAQLVQKNINIQPTLEIRSGANFNILLTRDMILPALYQG